MDSAADTRDGEDRVPRLAPDWTPEGCSFSPTEGFLLSRIDGRTPWIQLRQIGGIPPEEVDRCLERWIGAGIVVVLKSREIAESEAKSPPEGKTQARGESFPKAVDPGLDLSEEMQRRILDFEASLDRPYHELLGVARDADAKAIKRAYFGLSKLFHPDRYYGREIGHLGPRLERIFKRVVEAYELLSDPMARAEIERSLEQRPAPAPPAAPAPEAERRPPPGAGVKRSRKRVALERLRRQFRVPEKILAERRFRASQFCASARAAAHRGSWLEAAAGVRLAIAFDPWNDEYKAYFAEVQSRVQELRAAALLEAAEVGSDESSRQEALHLYEEVLAFRPNDPEVNHRAAELALELGELDQAQEYAEAACELSPETAVHHRTLARALRRAGLRERAKQVLERALRLDPENKEARAELESLRRSGRRKSGGMS